GRRRRAPHRLAHPLDRLPERQGRTLRPQPRRHSARGDDRQGGDGRARRIRQPRRPPDGAARHPARPGGGTGAPARHGHPHRSAASPRGRSAAGRRGVGRAHPGRHPRRDAKGVLGRHPPYRRERARGRGGVPRVQPLGLGPARAARPGRERARRGAGGGQHPAAPAAPREL
ncbi:MAG: hypothetical protein AVDCRST_MAG19-2929, partial [uncultured Thermomicrobiales bacterium]